MNAKGVKVTTPDNFPWKAPRIGNHFHHLQPDAVRGWKEVLRWKPGLGPKESPAHGWNLPFTPDTALPNFAAIPIGAYRPFWFMHPLHVQPLEAVRLHQDLRAKRSIAMHWGTFALADDPLQEPPLLLKQALLTHAVAPDAFQLLRFGETVRI